MKYLMLSLVIFTQGCAQMIPARSWDQGDGLYKLEASGNAFASSESLYENIEKKANKICGVNGFYYIENSDPKWHGQTSYSNGMAITASYQVLTKTISCK